MWKNLFFFSDFCQLWAIDKQIDYICIKSTCCMAAISPMQAITDTTLSRDFSACLDARVCRVFSHLSSKMKHFRFIGCFFFLFFFVLFCFLFFVLFYFLGFVLFCFFFVCEGVCGCVCVVCMCVFVLFCFVF